MRFLLFLLVLLPYPILAQSEGDWDELMQQMAEEQMAETGDEQTWEAQQELLTELHENPLDLNNATRQQLMILPFLSQKAVDAILDYRVRNGVLRTLGELRLIRDLSPQERRWLPLFVIIEAGNGRDQNSKFKSQKRNSLHHDLTTRVDIPLYERDGWPWQRGIAHRLRYTLHAGQHLDAGLRIAKDAGEPMFNRDNPFWDSYGGHIMLRDLGSMQTAILGDFKAGFGEGLVMNNGLRFGKLSMGLWRTLGGIRPHRSADEVNFLRGAAATFVFGQAWSVTAFGSWRQLDATVAADNSVSTIATTGLHRTAGELEHKGTLGSHTVGVHAQWQHRPWNAGITGVFQHYDHQFVQHSTALYRQIYPEGYLFGAASVDYGYRHSRLLISGETARSFDQRGGGWATLNKAAWRFSANTQLAAIQRFYSKDYYSPHASAYGENSRVQNESGLSILFDADRLGPIALHTLFDVFYSPWPRYTMTRASTGYEMLVQATYQPRRSHSLQLRYSIKSKEQSDRRHLSHRLRTTYVHTFSPHWSLQAAAFAHFYHEAGSNNTGLALAPRADYATTDQRLRCSLMAILFRTADYDSRLYLYEPSLFQTFGLQQLYGRGQRLAATLRLRTANRRWTLQTKVGVTHYTDRTEISSGPLHITSPWKADVQLLLRWRM